jgi:hypothetical protein
VRSLKANKLAASCRCSTTLAATLGAELAEELFENRDGVCGCPNNDCCCCCCCPPNKLLELFDELAELAVFDELNIKKSA